MSWGWRSVIRHGVVSCYTAAVLGVMLFHMAYTASRKRLWDYFVPLFILLAAGAIVALSIQLYQLLSYQREATDSTLYVAQGHAKVLPWGTSSWSSAVSGMHVLQGDAVKTLTSSRAALRFFQSAWIRLGEDTQATVRALDAAPSRNQIEFAFDRGDVWVAAKPADKEVAVQVNTPHLQIAATGAVFAVHVETGASVVESVRVFDGSVSVSVMPDSGAGGAVGDKARAVDTITVAAGNQFTMRAPDYAAFVAYQSPDIVAPLATDAASDSWVIWNQQEDRSPTNFDAQKPAVVTPVAVPVATPVTTSPVPVAPVSPVVVPSQNVSPVTSLSLSAPHIVRVGGQAVGAQTSITVHEAPIVIEGSASGAAKIVINNFALTKFASGATMWKYALKEDYGNLVAGKNVIRMYAVDAAGVKSSVEVFTVIYEPAADAAAH